MVRLNDINKAELLANPAAIRNLSVVRRFVCVCVCVCVCE